MAAAVLTQRRWRGLRRGWALNDGACAVTPSIVRGAQARCACTKINKHPAESVNPYESGQDLNKDIASDDDLANALNFGCAATFSAMKSMKYRDWIWHMRRETASALPAPTATLPINAKKSVTEQPAVKCCRYSLAKGELSYRYRR